MAEPKSEDALIDWIRHHATRQSDDLLIGIGDDMAMVRTAPTGLLVTSDMLMDGVDFNIDTHSPEAIGRKALAVSLSDCAAMAVRPRWAMVSVALPNSWTMAQAKDLFNGMSKLAEQFDCQFIGGDTNSWNNPLVIDVTVLAEPWQIEEKSLAPVQRNGMKPGDLLVVTGELGGSIDGHHMDFIPRVLEARALRLELGATLHAMIDISDGLSTDATRISRASNCGIAFNADSLKNVASEAARKASNHSGRTQVDHVLNDGEDFELLFAVDADAWTAFEKSPRIKRPPLQCHVLGKAIEREGLWLVGDNGEIASIEPRGWQHFQDH